MLSFSHSLCAGVHGHRSNQVTELLQNLPWLPSAYPGRPHVLSLGLVCRILESLTHCSSLVLFPVTCWARAGYFCFPLGSAQVPLCLQSFPSVKPISQSITVLLSSPTRWSSDTFLAVNTSSDSLGSPAPHLTLTE